MTTALISQLTHVRSGAPLALIRQETRPKLLEPLADIPFTPRRIAPVPGWYPLKSSLIYISSVTGGGKAYHITRSYQVAVVAYPLSMLLAPD